LVNAAPVFSSSDHERLYKKLFSKYESNVAPFSKGGASLDVEFGVNPIYFDLDATGVLKGRVWNKYSWEDPRLAFDPEEFGGISSFRVDPVKLWVPDIALYNR
jgi:nicotinic acetylcholine receptor